MLRTIPNVLSEVVLAKGEAAYEPVIDAFSSATHVSVVTFNVSEKRNRLLDALKQVTCEARLITAIPRRYPSYRSDNARAAATASISTYLGRLDPSQFAPLTRVSFCFANHAKIILTDSIGYVGSANFSDESADNWEAGVLIRDPHALRQLRGLVDEIERDAIRYYGPSMQPHVATLLALRDQIPELGRHADEPFTTEAMEAVEDWVERFRNAVTAADRTWAETEDATGPICSSVDMELLHRIEDWFGDRDLLWELGEAGTRHAEAMAGEYAVDDLPTNNDGEFTEGIFQDYTDDKQRNYEDKLAEAGGVLDSVQEAIQTLSSQIEGVCRAICEHLRRIRNV